MKKTLYRSILLILLIALAGGCSWSKKDKEPKQKALTDYRESREISALEIPPDLSSDSVEKSLTVPKYQQKTTTATDAQQAAPKVIAGDTTEGTTAADSSASSTAVKSAPKMYIERSGSQRWLVIHQSYSATWSDVRDFILSSGLALEREDKEAGILETTWADNYAKSVLSGTQKYLGKWIGSIYTSPSRDKFRIRVEPGRVAGTSEVFLSHRGMIEKAVIDNNVDPVRTIWEPIPPDTSIEAEMLTLLMVDLGASESEASASFAKAEDSVDRARIVKGATGQPALIVDDAIDIAWRRVGQTLDRVGFSVEDRDISKRVYFVEYADPELSNKKPGFFSKMFKKDKSSADDDIYQILLIEQGDKTAVEVTAKDGTPAPDKVTEQIVKLLYEQLK
jgi:outer membrane protein assembly factor BamC